MNVRVLMRVISLLSAFSPLLAEEASAPTPTNEPNAYILKVPYKTEQEWFVGSICRNALELLSFIVDKKGEIISPDHVSVTKINADQVAYQCKRAREQSHPQRHPSFPRLNLVVAGLCPFL